MKVAVGCEFCLFVLVLTSVYVVHWTNIFVLLTGSAKQSSDVALHSLEI